MSERASGKQRKSPASKALASKQPASKAAKKSAGGAKKAPAAAAGKSKSVAKGAGNPAALDPPTLQARIVKLEGECARLLAELEKAQGRIRELEEGRDQVLTRIDYVIDSLRSLIEIDQ